MKRRIHVAFMLIYMLAMGHYVSAKPSIKEDGGSVIIIIEGFFRQTVEFQGCFPENEGELLEISLHKMTGEEVKHQQISGTQANLNIAALPTGNYRLRIAGNGCIQFREVYIP